jgi:hypothetical protein
MLEPRGLALLLAACLAAAGCASQQDLRREELSVLLPLLPGVYDNRIQAAADAGQPRGHEGLTLTIVPVFAPTIGKHVFYLQETALDDLMRVLSQRVFTIDVGPDGRIVQTLMTFVEPQRWRDGPRNLELFKALVEHDVRASGGCDLFWKKVDQGFEASNDSRRCRTNSRATGEVLRVESRAKLDAEGISLSDQQIDAAGRIVYGDLPDPFYHFKRRAQ